MDSNNEQWASSLLGGLSGIVLPIFYGLLGAGAAVVRLLSAKMKEWLLAPRDLLLSLIQLALGAVIGAVHLTPSALRFIAGFFVEGVFVALEGLMRRVFNIADPTAKPTP